MSGALLMPWIQGHRAGAIHVVGASGAEGVAVLLFLVEELGLAGVVAHDFSADPREFARSFRKANTAWDRDAREDVLRRLLRLPITLQLGPRYLVGIERASLICASQNWFNYPANLPALPSAVAAGTRLIGVVDLAMDVFPGVRVGVTGSNGKSTTAGLLSWMLGRGLPATQRLHHGGNDRDRQASLAALRAAGSSDRLVWEVSNRHLRDRVVPVDVAVLTNVTHNHIEDHGSFEAYVEAKARLVTSSVAGGGHAVLTVSDPISQGLVPRAREAGRTVWHAGSGVGVPEAEGAIWSDEGAIWASPPGQAPRLLGRAETLGLPGAHNRLNLMTAAAGALAAGAAPDTLAASWASFAPLAGRLELVAEQDAIQWIYDIQATTAPAAEAGIAAIGASRPVVLIVGGDDKGMDYSGMAAAAAAYGRAVIALPGTGTDAFLASLGDRLPVSFCASLDDGLERARAVARAGDAVLTSPGCAFFASRFVEGRSFHGRVADLLAGDR